MLWKPVASSASVYACGRTGNMHASTRIFFKGSIKELVFYFMTMYMYNKRNCVNGFSPEWLPPV